MVEGTSPAPIEAVPAARRPVNPSGHARGRTGRLWRAVAGMFLALGLGIAAVTLEFHAQSQGRADHLRRQLNREQSRVLQLQHEVASANHQMAVAGQELAAQQTLDRILLRPETKLIHFEKSDSALSGFVALNQELAIAAIAINGAQMAKQAAEVSWVPRNRPPVPAAQFSFDGRGRAITFVELPPFFRTVDSLIIDLHPAPGAKRDSPNKPLLRASVAPAVTTH